MNKDVLLISVVEMEKFKLDGKVVRKELNGHMVEVFVPSGKGPSWDEVRPIFEEMGRTLKSKKLAHDA